MLTKCLTLCTGIVTAKIDEQKTDETKAKIQAIVNNL